MNVVLVNDAGYVRGGGDRVAFDSAVGLAAQGNKVVLFTAFGPTAPELESHPNLRIVAVGASWIRGEQTSPRAALRGIWNWRAARRLREELAALNPKETVVHVHLYSSALSASVIDAAQTAGFVTILTIHDYFITCPNGAYFVFPKAQVCDLRALSFSCLVCNCDSRKPVHKAWRFARTVVQNRIARIPHRISAYVAVSETAAALARRDLPADARIEVIANTVDVAQQPPVNVKANRNLVFIGRLESYKGPQLLAKAAARLRLPVVFCGSGPMEPALRELYPEAVFTGWIHSNQVIEQLAGARAFIFPSVYRETFGVSAAEALARGIPVVASRGTAAVEFVHHRRNGLLFEHNSVDDLAIQLEALADDTRVAELGARAYADYWAKPLTADLHVAKINALYHSLLGSAGDDPPGEQTLVPA